MATILGILGSPRGNGNTHILVSHILDGAREAGAEAEAVLLKDLTIQECDGCHACVRVCSTGALTGTVKQVHFLDKSKCIKCGACLEACTREAIGRA